MFGDGIWCVGSGGVGNSDCGGSYLFHPNHPPIPSTTTTTTTITITTTTQPSQPASSPPPQLSKHLTMALLVMVVIVNWLGLDGSGDSIVLVVIMV